MTLLEKKMKEKKITIYRAAKECGGTPQLVNSWVKGRVRSPRITAEFLAFCAFLRSCGIGVTVENWKEYTHGV